MQITMEDIWLAFFSVQENLDFLYLFDEVAVNFIEGQFKRGFHVVKIPLFPEKMVGFNCTP